MFLRNWSFPGRYSPEWGSGGVFGLKYHEGVLYYTLAFEAEAHFVDVKGEEERIYAFDMLGPSPRSGGDTYNAVEAVDEFLYFGGWVHAPARYHGGRVSFVDKYSHVHVYDVEEGTIKLLWKDSIHSETRWAGEIGDILYDPLNDRLLLAREDGHEHLGVYSLDRKRGEVTELFREPSPKGTILHDTAVFGIGSNFSWGVEKFGVLSLESGKWEFIKPGSSVDGGNVVRPELGSMATSHNRFFAFVRGGVFVGSSFLEEEPVFYRLFDFPTFYAPFRVNSLNVGGGLLTAYNSYHDVSFGGSRWGEFTHLVAGPTVLVYITPPVVRIVGAVGARITSIEKIGGNLLLGANNSPNTGETSATPFDTGVRDIVLTDEKSIWGPSPSVAFSLPLNSLKLKGDGVFGGVPLDGYSDPRVVFYVNADTKLTVYEYDLSLPSSPAEKEIFALKRGKNIIELSSFSGIVSFGLEKVVEGKARIELR